MHGSRADNSCAVPATRLARRRCLPGVPADMLGNVADGGSRDPRGAGLFCTPLASLVHVRDAHHGSQDDEKENECWGGK